MSMEDGDEGKKKEPLHFDFRLMSIADGNENEEKEKLPLDLVLEVLSWSDVNTLASCRLVCKEWQNFISKSHFVNLHLQRTKTIRGFFIQGDYRGHHNVSFLTQMMLQFSLDFLPEPVKIEASTGDQTGHGLLCCADLCERRYYVCKPTTREWNILPNPNRKFSTIKMGMGIVNMCTPPVFKIVRLSVCTNRKANTKTYFTEVFDSVKWEWKILQSLPRIDFSLLGPTGMDGDVVVINRSFYWLSIPLPSKMRPPLIVSFDLETNEWSQVVLPKTSVTDDAGFRDDAANIASNVNFKLVKFSGYLALVIQDIKLDFGCSQVDVWVMTSKINQSWMKKESFILDAKRGALFHGFFAADAALVTEWKVFGGAALKWYDYKNKKSTEVGEDIQFNLKNIHLFQSDYVPCNIGKRNVIPLLDFYCPQIIRSKGERDLSMYQILRAREREIWRL